MTIPRSRILVVNNGLALVEVPADKVHLCIGYATSGPLYTPRAVQYTSLCNTFRGGIAVKAAAYVTARTEATVIFVRIPATARAASFDVRLDEWNGSTNIVVTGTPTTGALVKLKTNATGTVGTTGITYQVSLDGGVTYGATTALGTNTTITANGCTFTLTSGQTFDGTAAILCLPASATIYDVSVTKDGASGDISLTGTPIDLHEVIVEFMKGGVAGEEGIAIRYTLDNGRRWSETIRIGVAVAYELPDYTSPDGTVVGSGITLEIVSGDAYKAGDKISARTTPPECQPSDVLTALDAVEAEVQFAGKFSFVHAVGHLGRRADVTTLQGKLDALVPLETFTGLLTAGRDQAPGEPETEWEAEQAEVASTMAADRVFVSGGYCRITDPCGRWSLRRPVAFRAAERLIARPIAELLNDFSVGAVDDMDIFDEDGSVSEYDSRLSSVMHDARYITLRTRKKRPGVYFCGSPTMAPAGTDFQVVPYRRLMDIASSVFQVVGEDQLGRGIVTNKNTGLIDESSAQIFDTALNEAVRDAVSVSGSGAVQGAVAVQIRVSRTLPIIGPNGKLVGECRVVPISYIGEFLGTIAFVRKLPSAA